MRVAILHPFFEVRGGAERKILLMTQNLRKKYQIDIITHKVEKEKTFYELVEDLHFVVSPYGKNVVANIISIIKTGMSLKNYDLYNPHNFPAHVEATIGKMLYGRPIVWFCNEPFLFLEGTKERRNGLRLKMYQFIEKMLVKKIDVVVANSKYTAQNIEKSLHVKSTVIYSGIDTDLYKPQGLEKRDQIFFVSRIEKGKNVDFLIEMMPEIWKRDKDVKLIIAGEGAYLPAIRDRVRKLKMKKVNLLGNISEERKRRLYEESKVIVFPTFNEPLGVIPMEAMACGTPVVAFNSGGCKETIVHGKTGLLAGNKEEFIKDVFTLLYDHELNVEMGKEGRKRVIELFSVQQMVNKAEEIYGELLNKVEEPTE
jgi:glycosyltransferase involved in cell wall biosynthesis